MMSDYTVVSFELNDPNKLKAIKAFTKKLFDATDIKDLQVEHRFCYALCISELDLQESLGILDELKKKFNLKFVVEYGVY